MEGNSVIPVPFSAFDDDRVREILERFNIRVTSQNAEEFFHAVDFAYGASWPLMLMHKTKDGTILVVTEGKACGQCPEYRVYMAEILPCPKGLTKKSCWLPSVRPLRRKVWKSRVP